MTGWHSADGPVLSPRPSLGVEQRRSESRPRPTHITRYERHSTGVTSDPAGGGWCFVVTVLRTGLAGAEGRTAAIGRNRYETTITDQQEHERDEDRHNDGKARNIRQDKRGFILRDGAGPLRDRSGLGPTVAAGLAIPHRVKMGNPILPHILRQNTGRADDTGHEPDAHEQAGECPQPRPSTEMPREKHVTKDGVHRQRSCNNEALTLRNSRRNCLPTPAHSCYSPHRILAMRTAFTADVA